MVLFCGMLHLAMKFLCEVADLSWNESVFFLVFHVFQVFAIEESQNELHFFFIRVGVFDFFLCVTCTQLSDVSATG